MKTLKIGVSVLMLLFLSVGVGCNTTVWNAAFEMESGHYDHAISDLNKAIEKNPKDKSAYRLRGSAYAHKNQYDQAISDYNKAIELDTEHGWHYTLRGIAYVYKNQYDQAISDFNKAIELGSKYGNKVIIAEAYGERGKAYVAKGQYDQAIFLTTLRE